VDGLENLDLGNLLKNVDMDKVKQMFAAMNSGNSNDSEPDEPFDVEPIIEDPPTAPPFDLSNIDPNMLKNMFTMMNGTSGGDSDNNPLGGLAGLLGNAGKSGGGKSAGGNSNPSGGSRHTAMLHALKPYLSVERRGKLDMASKLMSLAQFAPLFKDML